MTSDIAHPTALGLTPFGGNPSAAIGGGGIMIPSGILNSKTLQIFRAGPAERGQTPELACGGAFTLSYSKTLVKTELDLPKFLWVMVRQKRSKGFTVFSVF